MSDFKGNAPKSVSAGAAALSQPPLGKLTALPRPLAGKGDEPLGGKGIGWSEKKEGKGRAGKGRGGW